MELRIDPLEYRFFQVYLSKAICNLLSSYNHSTFDEHFFHRLLYNDHHRIQRTQNTFRLVLFLRERQMEPFPCQGGQKQTRPRCLRHIYASLGRHHCLQGTTIFQSHTS